MKTIKVTGFVPRKEKIVHFTVPDSASIADIKEKAYQELCSEFESELQDVRIEIMQEMDD